MSGRELLRANTTLFAQWSTSGLNPAVERVGKETPLVCQRCYKGLVVDPMLEDLEKTGLLSTGAITQPKSSRSLSQSEGDTVPSLNSNLLTLMEMATDSSGLDHPLCAECAQLLTIELHKHLNELEHDHDRYLHFQASLEEQVESQELSQMLLKLEVEELEVLRLLEEARTQREEAERALEQHQLEAIKLELIEEHYWDISNEFEAQMLDFREEEGAVTEEKRRFHSQLEKLRATNVWNDTFYISRDGHFGTINNLRIGSLPSQPVRSIHRQTKRRGSDGPARWTGMTVP